MRTRCPFSCTRRRFQVLGATICRSPHHKTGAEWELGPTNPAENRRGQPAGHTIRDEDLQGNAARVGARLSAGLGELARKHPMIGYVHGRGLYQGIELVRDPDTRKPATKEAVEICERLRELGVIEHATGDHSNVLKVKPPLCITQERADFFVDRLDEVLSTGW